MLHAESASGRARFDSPVRTPFPAVRVLASVFVGSLILSSSSIGAAADGFSPRGAGLGPVGIDLAAFQGDWQRLATADDESARFSAIEKAIDDLAWIVRKMAGGVLRSSTAPPKNVNFEWDGSLLHQRLEGNNGSFTRPVDPDAEPLEATDKRGDPFTSSWTWADDGIALTWQQHQAHGRNVYRIDSDGDTLVVEHTINVTALDGVEPIVYRSRFAREQRPPAVSSGRHPNVTVSDVRPTSP